MDSKAPLQEFRVIWRAGHWRVLVDGLVRSAHDFRVDAEEAALRLARRTADGGSRAVIFVQRGMCMSGAFDVL